MPGAHQLQLGIQFKKTDNIDIKSPLQNFIKHTYSSKEAENALDDLLTVQRLRAEIAAAQNGSQPTLRETMTKYIRCLTLIETRFPVSKEKAHAQINFVWYDAFRPNKRTAQYNIYYEKAGVLFNLAAALSQQALACDRTAPEGLKAACQYFQEAAGVFQYMTDSVLTKTDAPRPTDLSADCISMLEKLMLAQAQENAFNRVRLEGKTSPATLARLSKQASIMYSEVERLLGTPALLAHMDKTWKSHVQMKASLYDVESLVQYAKSFRANDEVNVEICILTEAFKRLQSTKKLAYDISSEMYETTKTIQDGIQLALTKAEKDNNTVYLQRVPAFLDQPGVQGASLVKPLPPSADLMDASQEQLFSGLVPDVSAKALSRYSDLVDGLIREEVGRLVGATDVARLRLREWELPDALQALDANSHGALPEGLLRELEDIESIGGVKHLREIMSEIGELRKSVDLELKEAQKSLEEEAAADAEARTEFGPKWSAPSSTTLAKPYWDRLATYKASMQKAGDSDEGVVRRLRESESGFSVLRIDSAVQQMPRLQAPIINTSNEDPVRVVADLRRNLDALQALAAERAGMEEALQDTKRKDNILPKLMAVSPSALDQLFVTELQKYDALRADVAKNLSSQQELLAKVDRDNRLFRQVFDTAGWRTACDRAAVAVRGQTQLFRELLNHLSEGLRFYMGMSEVVKKAKQECADYAFTRSVQRDDMKQDLRQRAVDAENKARGGGGGHWLGRVAGAVINGVLQGQQQQQQQQQPGPAQPPPYYPVQQPAPPMQGSYPQPMSPDNVYGQQTPHTAYYGTPQAAQPTPHYGYGSASPQQPYGAPQQSQQGHHLFGPPPSAPYGGGR